MRIEAGRYRGRRLPEVRDARPVPGRLRRSLFQVLGEAVEDARVLDLFAGIGGLGLEALSRGAAHIILAERDARAVRALQTWIRDVGASARARAERVDVLRAPLPPGPFDLVFLDPPFALWGTDSVPGLLARAVAVLAPDGRVAVKLPARTEIPEDPAWQVLRRRAMGSVAWALLAVGAGSGES